MPHKDPEASRAYFRKYLKEYRKRPDVAAKSAARSRATYSATPPDVRAVRVERAMERRRLRKAFLVASFGGRCPNCGFQGDAAAFDFDHIDPSAKSRSITEMLGRGASDSALSEELAKCRMLCANCHRVVSSKGALPAQVEFGTSGC
jgi:hypothetical protein